MESTYSREVFSRDFATLISAALIVVVGLTWQSTLMQMFQAVFPGGGSIVAMIIYSIILTAIVIFVVIWLTRRYNVKRNFF